MNRSLSTQNKKKSEHMQTYMKILCMYTIGSISVNIEKFYLSRVLMYRSPQNKINQNINKNNLCRSMQIIFMCAKGSEGVLKPDHWRTRFGIYIPQVHCILIRKHAHCPCSGIVNNLSSNCGRSFDALAPFSEECSPISYQQYTISFCYFPRFSDPLYLEHF